MRILYRLRQLKLALFAKDSDIDLEFVKKYLNKQELKLFLLAPNYERRHGINVAKDILTNVSFEQFQKIDKENFMMYDDFIKAALLHDIGKVPGNISILDKGLLVIFDKVSSGRLKNVNNKKVYYHYNHGEIGVKMLTSTGNTYNESFNEVIQNHHSSKCTNKYVRLFRIYDDRN